jgi:ubiquinone/menaquinone biosynthesis C-methylase UbiE
MTPPNRILLLLLLLGTACTSQVSPSAGPTNDQRITRKTSTPYSGDLSIFESADRYQKLQIERVMDILKIHEGSTVADIGAGSGWFTVRAAKRVGDSGSVYAEDINPQAIKYIDDRMHGDRIHNVHTIVGKEDDPRLPEDKVDAVLILKTYHEIAQPVILLQNLRKSLRAGALVGIIDRNGNGEDHGIQKDVIVQEAQRAGYRLLNQYDFVKADREDYFLIFQPNP